MSESLTAAYIEKAKKDGPDASFEFVYNTCNKKIERNNYNKLSNYCYKIWGRCIDPANHKFDVTSETFLKFSEFNNKFYESEYKLELINIEVLLCQFSKYKIYEHFYRRICKDLPPGLIKGVVDEVEYLLPDIGLDIEYNSIYTEALESLPIEYHNALKDTEIYGFSHEEISQIRGISVSLSKKRKSRAIRMLRQFQGR